MSASEIPAWLNSEFLENHLRKYSNDTALTVRSFQTKVASIKGGNFTSAIYRVAVELVDGRTKHLIVKAALTSEVVADTLSDLDPYKKEIDFYKQIAPQINSLLKKFNDIQLLPALIGACEKRDIFVFEDMNAKGYCMADVKRGLDFEATKMVLKNAAILHACGAVLQQNQPNIFEKFKFGSINPEPSGLDAYFCSQFDVMLETVSQWPDFAEYAAKLKQLRDNLLTKAREMFTIDPNQFNGLCHGDMWVNNMLFKYANGISGDVENVVFIDFQLPYWNSPAFDLQYFFGISVEESLRPDRFGELVGFYHEHLSDALRRLEYKKPIPTLEEFQQQFQERSYFGFMTSCLSQPIVLNEKNEDADIEALIL